MGIEKENLEHISDSLDRYWLHNQQIVVYEPHDTHRKTVDQWAESVIKLAHRWEPTKPYLEIQDMRRAAATPYSIQRAKAAIYSLEGLTGYSAVIITNNPAASMFKFFVRQIRPRAAASKGVEHRIFTNFEEAFAWLEEKLR